MRVLVVVGFVIPEAAELIQTKKTPYGGWVSQLLRDLRETSDYKIGIAMKSELKDFKKIQSNGIDYFYLPEKGFKKLDVSTYDCQKVINDFEPNLIHAEGGEVYITNRFFSIYKGAKILSIKGILNDISKYEYGYINFKRNITIKNLILFFLLFYTKNIRFRNRKKIEKDSYSKCTYVIGRTNYDKAHSLNFNPDLKYFHCNESLRPPFYKNLWNEDAMEPFTIMIGNGNIPRKGLHIVLETIGGIIEEFPKIKILIVGKQKVGFTSKIGYSNYIGRIIKKHNLERHCVFLGELNETEMAEKMSTSNLMIIPSVVENSSNTLGEAMIIGMPCIVAYSGGVSSLATDEKEVLFYRASDKAVLAHQIKRILTKEIDVQELSRNARSKAQILFDKELNAKRLRIIYKSIMNEI